MKRKIYVLALALLFSILNISNVYSSMFFYDVFGHWAEDTIFWASNDYPLFNGYEDGSFKPNNFITRSEYISILYRAANINKVISSNNIEENTNEDIAIDTPDSTAEIINDESKNVNGEIDSNATNNSENTIYEEEVNETKQESEDNNLDNDVRNDYEEKTESSSLYSDLEPTFWAYQNITTVIEYINSLDNDLKFEDIFIGDTFNPNQYITREEAALLTSFFDYPAIEEKDLVLTDILPTYQYYDEIKNLVNNGIINGYDDNTFKPKNNITRAEAATLIQKVFKEMEHGKEFIKDIEMISDIYDNKFMYFGNYFTDMELQENDDKYIRVLRTLEYLDFVETIPYDEKENYDDNPLQTLKELKKENYWNKIGLNYYLIKYKVVKEDDYQTLLYEMLEDFLKRDDIKSYEAKTIFNEMFIYSVQNDILDKAFNKWQSETSSQEEYFNAIFTKSKLFVNNNRLEEAVLLYKNVLDNNKMETNNINIIKKFYFNKAYLEYRLDNLNECEETLRNLLNIVRLNKINNYSLNELEEQLVGYIKVILNKKLNKSPNIQVDLIISNE